jgi:hypothetical protein
VGGQRRKNLIYSATAAAVLAVVIAAPGTAAQGDPGTISWQAPSPATGSVVSSGAGSKLTIKLTASSLVPTAVVRIARVGKLPRGAKLASVPGNPAHATLTWTPTGRQIGNRVLRFTAADNSPVKLSAPTLAVTTQVGPGIRALSGVDNVSRWAYVIRKAVVRSAPRVTAHAKGRLSNWTPENYPNLALALQQRIERSGTWVQVRLAMLPNNSTGWIKRGALGSMRITHDHLVVNRSTTRATLFRDGEALFSTRVGVGKSFWPTPRGEFYVTEKMSGFRDAAYGPVAFGTSARSPVLTDWPGGGFIGIHGTDAPGLIPGHVSHGCVRLRNIAILRLARMMQIGTPLSIQ